MALKIECDGPQCGRTSRATDDGKPREFGWITLIRNENSVKVTTHHYCSYSCAHAHTYLLISGDNGK